MAIVNYGVQSPDLTLDVQMELSDADSARVVEYLMVATPYGTVTENVQKEVPNPAWSPDQEDPNDPPEFILVQEWVTRRATPQETVIAYGEATMNQLNQAAYEWDKQRAAAIAAAQAAANVTPIVPIVPPHPVP
jgi:hypothetical protein